MGKVEKAINMMKEEFKKEFGENAELEDGDMITGVFNDGIIAISKDKDGMTVDIKAGEPYKFNYNLDLVV